MSAPFVEKLFALIKASPKQSISLSDYMALCAKHYYNHKDPFGTHGDFTTAPEVSQMFGELIGLFFAQHWIAEQQDSILVELGGGRGTLMSDALRATKVVAGFNQAMKVYFVEQSDLLKDKQKQNNPEAHFVERISDIHEEKPLYLIANEFFDALPICQFERTAKGWQERRIALKDNKLVWKLPPSQKDTDFPASAEIGAVAENSKASESLIKDIAKHIQRCGGLALIIDYGDDSQPTLGDTLQAVKRHKFHPLFESPGEADITAHVRFARLAELAKAQGAHVFELQTQKTFLESLGIKKRAEMLAARAPLAEQQNISAALKRLTAPAQMGGLFKVMIMTRE